MASMSRGTLKVIGCWVVHKSVHGRQAMQQRVSLQLHAVTAAAAQAVQPLSQPSVGLPQLLESGWAQSREQRVLAVR